MAWLVKKEDYKIGERYIHAMLTIFAFTVLRWNLFDSRTGLEKDIVQAVAGWTGGEGALADLVAVFIIGTWGFPFILAVELWELSERRKRALRREQGNGTKSYRLGRWIGALLSKFGRSGRT